MGGGHRSGTPPHSLPALPGFMNSIPPVQRKVGNSSWEKRGLVWGGGIWGNPNPTPHTPCIAGRPRRYRGSAGEGVQAQGPRPAWGAPAATRGAPNPRHRDESPRGRQAAARTAPGRRCQPGAR